MKNFSSAATVLLTIFIDLLCFGIILPLLPSFSIQVLHINEFVIGLSAGIYSLMQFLFLPFWGALSDRYGRKPVITISLFGSIISNLLLAFVFSGTILSVSFFIFTRALAGVFAANISAAQAVISDITTHEERTKGIGYVSAAFSLGFVFGPAIGGILSEKFGFAIPVFFSSGLSFIAFLMSIFVLKESLPDEIMKRNRNVKQNFNPLNFKKYTAAVKNKTFGKFIVIFFVSVFSFSNIFGTLQLFCARTDGLNFNQEEIGYILSFMGIIGAIVQLYLLKMLDKLIGSVNTLLSGCILAAIGLALLGYSGSAYFLMFTIAVLASGNGLCNTMSASLLTQHVSSSEQGSIIGINHSLGSLARFFGPVWGGFIYQYAGYKFPFITGGFFMILLYFYSHRVLKN
ncbi:MAG: Tetracycline resistance protein, class C [Ignavibacteria bacterium]|nr:Tetracycline resistance protein, class C [Ignavibacteria bacterium]